MNFVVATSALGLGITISLLFSHAGIAVFCCGVLLAALLLCRHLWWTAGLLLLFALGGLLGDGAWRRAFQDDGIPENTPLRVEATLLQGPLAIPPTSAREASASPSEAWRLVLRLEKVEGSGATGVIAVRIDGAEPTVLPGDRVSFRARLYRPRGYLNPGMPNAQLAAAARELNWVGALERPQTIARVADSSWFYGPWRAMHRFRRALSEVIEQAMPPRLAGFVRVMVLGERSITDGDVELGFRAAGATHALSVSGLHLAVVCGAVFFLFSRVFSFLPGAGLWFSPRSLAALISIPLLWLYTILTGEAVATVRSAWMATYMLVGIILLRPPCLAASIAFAVLVLLVRNPLLVVDISFQLSFLSVIALGLFIRPAQATGPSDSEWPIRAGRRLRRALWVSTVACLMTTPLVAYHFAQSSPAAPIGNLALVPIVELLVLPLGLLGAILGSIHPCLGVLPLWLAGQGTRVTLWLAELFRRFAPIWNVPSPTQLETTLFLVGIGACLWGRPTRWLSPKRRFLLGGLCLSLAFALMAGRGIYRYVRSDLGITLIDVGQGESILIEGPAGFVALVDGGGLYDDSFDIGERVVVPFLNSRMLRTIDLVVVSHPHPDHLNGLFAVLRRFQVRRLWTNGDGAGNPRWSALMTLALEKGVLVESAHPIAHHGLMIVPRGPWLGMKIQAPEGMDANNASLVLQLQFAGRKVLLTGDIGDQAEFELLGTAEEYGGVQSDVLKVPHHGSRHSSGAEFIAAVRPSLALISAGRHNRYGLPNPVALERYSQAGIPVIRTDLSGAVSIRIEKSGALSATCVQRCR